MTGCRKGFMERAPQTMKRAEMERVKGKRALTKQATKAAASSAAAVQDGGMASNRSARTTPATSELRGARSGLSR